MYNTKNYLEQGGEKLVIGGELEVLDGATVTGIVANTSPASAEALGGVKAGEKGAGDTVEVKIGEDAKLYVPTYPVVEEIPVAEHQADSVATDVAGLVTDFNALLAKLISAGLMNEAPAE